MLCNESNRKFALILLYYVLVSLLKLCAAQGDNAVATNDNGITSGKVRDTAVLLHIIIYTNCRYWSSWRRLSGDARHTCSTVSWLCTQANSIVRLCGTLCKLHTSKSDKYIDRSLCTIRLLFLFRCRAVKSGKWNGLVCAVRSRENARQLSRCSAPKSNMVNESLRKSLPRHR